jgi:glycosyltransferase involved in cell wall biosynthesis
MSGTKENARGGFKERARLEVVFLATAWGPTHGGINAFNMDFACALGRILGKGRAACVVLDVSDADVRSAGEAGVKLLQVGSSRHHSVFEASRAHDVLDALTSLKDAGIDLAAVTWWVGHDAITGELANKMPKVSKGGKSVVIHHMSYEDYQAFKYGDAKKARSKADLQSEIFGNADRAFAVGPLLLESLREMLEPLKKHGSARMIVPGLAQIEPCRESFERFQAITFGRMSRETDRIKQVRLAITSFADACSKKHRHSVPKPLRGQPRLYVYGIDQAEEPKLRKYAFDLAGRVLPFMPLPYGDRDSIFKKLRQMDIAMMLSWHEGFGLVGWEAISAEVPLIVTRNSGLYRLVDRALGDGGTALLFGIDIEGAEDPSGEHNFSDPDLENTREAIWKCAEERERAKRNASILLQKLRKKGYTWESAARKFAKELGLRVSLRAKSVGKVASPVGVATGRGLPCSRHRRSLRPIQGPVGVSTARGLSRMGHGRKLSMMDTRALLEASIGSDAYLAAEAAIQIKKRGPDETKRIFDADWQKAPEHATAENFLRDVFNAFGENFAHHLVDVLQEGVRSAVDVAIYAFPRVKDPEGRLYSWANRQVNPRLGDLRTMVLPMIAIGSAGLAAYAQDVIGRADDKLDGIVGETLVRLFVQADSRHDADRVLEAMCKFIQNAHVKRWANPGLLLTRLPTWSLTSAAVDSLVERGLAANQLQEIRSFASDAIISCAGTRRIVGDLIQRIRQKQISHDADAIRLIAILGGPKAAQFVIAAPGTTRDQALVLPWLVPTLNEAAMGAFLRDDKNRFLVSRAVGLAKTEADWIEGVLGSTSWINRGYAALGLAFSQIL